MAKTLTLRIRVEEQDKMRLETLALMERTNMSEVIRNLINERFSYEVARRQ